MGASIINKIEKSQGYILMLIALFLPISKKVVPILIILLIISWLLSGNLMGRLKGMIRNKYVWLFTSFYLLHVMGMLYTDNMGFGRFDLEIKMSFLIFPIVLASLPGISEKSYYNIFLAFIFGCTAACVADLVMGYNSYTISGDIKDMLYGKLSFYHHPTYFAMYLVLGVVVMLHSLILKSDSIPVSNKRLFLVLIPFFLIMIVLLMSKSAIASLVAVLIITIVYLMAKKQFMAAGGLTLSIVVAISGVLVLAPGVFDRITSSLVIVFQPPETIDPSTIESTAGRMLVWEQAIELIKDHPIIGVGTGDVKEALVAKYAASGLTGIEGKKLNAHNQFLQSFAALGVFGFLSLVLGLLLAAILALRRNQLVYFLFIVIIIVNAMTESILEVQAGVIFYAFFNSMFMFIEPVDEQV